MPTLYDVKTFADLVNAVQEELGVQTGDTTAINRIKRDINLVYRDVLSREDWKWLRRSVALSHEPYVSTGTITVTNGSTAATLSAAPTRSRRGDWLRVGGDLEVYRIVQHSANSTSVVLEVPYTGTTAAGAAYKIWSDRLALPVDVRDTFEVHHNLTSTPMEGRGLQEFRRIQVASTTSEGPPRFYTTTDYKDPEPYEAVSGLPVVSTLASDGLVKTAVFAANVSSLLSVGDRIEVSGATEYNFNGEAVISYVSTSTIKWTGLVPFYQTATADTPTVKLLSIESATERHRELLIHPALNKERVTVYADCIIESPPLQDDSDEPVIPIEERIVIVYGALARGWRKIGRNPEEAETQRALFEQKIAKMAGRFDDSTDHVNISPSKNYMAVKRSIARRRRTPARLWRFYD